MNKPSDIRRGDPITADFLNRSKNAGVHGVRGGGGLRAIQSGDNVVVSLPRPGSARGGSIPMPVRVTGILPTAGHYSGVELARQDDGTYAVRTDGQTFDANFPLLEQNRLPIANLASVVFARPFNTPSGLRAEFNSPTGGGFWAEITANEADGDNTWTYTFTQQVRASGGWTSPDNARTDTTARNSMEASNAATGIQGNGVDLDGQIFTDNSGLQLKPIRGNPVVWMVAEPDGSGGFYYTFSASNAIDGECA